MDILKRFNLLSWKLAALYLFKEKHHFADRKLAALYLFKGNAVWQAGSWLLILVQRETQFCRQEVGCHIFVQRETLSGGQDVGCSYLFKGSHHYADGKLAALYLKLFKTGGYS